MSERDSVDRIAEQRARRHVWVYLRWPFCRRCGIAKHSKRNPICLATPEPKPAEVKA